MLKKTTTNVHKNAAFVRFIAVFFCTAISSVCLPAYANINIFIYMVTILQLTGVIGVLVMPIVTCQRLQEATV